MASGGLESLTHVRYTVQSSDVLADMRVNVCKEGTQSVIWYKERFLADDEIVEHIVENATSTIHWTIHRPKRGWYIHLRSPAFPPGVHISLNALPQSSPYHSEASLSFACRTSVSPLALLNISTTTTTTATRTTRSSLSQLPPKMTNRFSSSSSSSSSAVQSNTSASSSTMSVDSDATLTDNTATIPGIRGRDATGHKSPSPSVVIHSYPPTPPSQAVSPRSSQSQALSPRAVEARLHQLQPASGSSDGSGSGVNGSGGRRLRPKSQLITSPQITHFLLSPHLQPQLQLQPPPPQPSQQQQQSAMSIFARLAAAWKVHAPTSTSTSSSFTLSPLPGLLIPPPPVPNLPSHPLATNSTTSLVSHSSSVPIPSPPPPPPTSPSSSPSITTSTPTSGSSSSSRVTSSTTPLKPLLKFHDTTPVWTVGSASGVLEVDMEAVKVLGVDLSFYVAVALTYLEFLAEREGYLAAASD